MELQDALSIESITVYGIMAAIIIGLLSHIRDLKKEKNDTKDEVTKEKKEVKEDHDHEVKLLHEKSENLFKEISNLHEEKYKITREVIPLLIKLIDKLNDE